MIPGGRAFESRPTHNIREGGSMKENDIVTKHVLVPKHTKLSEKEKTEILAAYRITVKELPKISKKDPAIQHLDPNPGDVIKVMRESKTSGQTTFYRGVF